MNKNNDSRIPPTMYSGTQTECNLLKALSAEAVAYAKYTYYASVAKKDGFEQIACFFQNTAHNEKEHGELWAKQLNIIGNTPTNLLYSADAEHDEWTHTYQDMAVTAKSEGFHDLADLFMAISKIEQEHEMRFRALLKNIETKQVFERSGICIWECRNCGHIETSMKAPEECPVCHHPQSYFELRATNY